MYISDNQKIQCVFHMSLLLYFICFVSDWECWVLSFLQCSMRNVLVCEMMIMVFVVSCDISNYKCCFILFMCNVVFMYIFDSSCGNHSNFVKSCVRNFLSDFFILFLFYC